MSYNSMSFVPEEVEKGLHWELIRYLIGLGTQSEKHFNDIHITSDGYCLIIEWVYVPYSREYGGSFEYVPDGSYVMKAVEYPDNHTEFLFEDEDEDEYLRDWLKEHPGWHKTEFGHWVHDDEEKAFETLKETKVEDND